MNDLKVNLNFLYEKPVWNTPLIKLKQESEQYNCSIYAKLELFNFTGTHKDRESAAVILDMKKKGYNELACCSTGNAAISISAYAYRFGFQAHIFIGSDTPEEKIKLIKLFKPKLHIIKGSFIDSFKASMKFIAKRKVYNANAGSCQAKLIGNSYIGREIAKKLKPTIVICPTNNGTLLVGVGMGLKKEHVKAKLVAAIAPETKIAHSIKGFSHLEEPKLTQIIKESNGTIVKVSDEEIKQAMINLIKQGLIVEPAAAVSIAALNHLNLKKKDKVCCVITGTGLKYPTLIQKVLG
ncbi:PLP-dependent lyase/thiolase [Candidatus Bathyarchaeota archaeon]|nr:PLP-dependent lyase/thiolase [Candidatus Bathyarchaeota archaeon]